MSYSNEHITGILLAGGKSSRMGFPKGLAKINGEPMIASVYQTLAPFCKEVMVIANSRDYDFLELPVYEDLIPGKGPLSGIHTGLSYTQTSLNLVLPADMPFINPEIFRKMQYHTAKADVVFPEFEERWFPLCGFYRKHLQNHFTNKLYRNQLKLTRVIRELNYQEVKFPAAWHKSFQNINTTQELKEAGKANQKKQLL